MGGLELLDEVLERDIYKKPREIIGLTAFSEVREKAGIRFAEDLWLVIQYDPASSEWKSQLQRKIKHIVLAKQSGTLPSYDSHLCVVTALPDPELTEVLRLPWNFSAYHVATDPTVYHRGTFKKGHEEWKVIAAHAPRMGMTAASILAMKEIQTFRPRYLAIVGITAGIRGKCDLGDIIAADPGWDYGSGKHSVETGSPSFAPAPHHIGLNSFIRGKLSLMAQDGAVLDEIRRGYRLQNTRTPLRMHLGPVASGAAVLEDDRIACMVAHQHRKLLGIEMETYGVYAAAEECPLPQPKVFSLKSVCDFADTEKSDDFQAYAAYTSASALRMFVERFL
jgi:nucleoside phosphorylase